MSDMAISARVPFSDPDRLPRERIVKLFHVRLEVVSVDIVPVCEGLQSSFARVSD